MKFETIPFKDLLSNIVDNRGKTCPTVDEGIPLIATNCITNKTLYPTYDKIRYVSEDTYKNWFRDHPEPEDIIFVTKGSPGRCNFAPDPVNFCIAQDMVAIRANEEKVHPKFLLALLRSPRVQHKISNMHVGTLIPHFKKSDFDKLMLDIPTDINYQKKIGEFYFNISKKIHYHNKINETLESIAQAIFKSWFVDFDPVRAKIRANQENYDAVRAAMATISGVVLDQSWEDIDRALEQKLANMTEDQRKELENTASLFPEAFVNSKLGEVPKEWKASTLGEEFTIINGNSPPGSSYNEQGEGAVFYQGRTDFGFRFPTQRVFCTQPKRFAEKGDTLLSVRAPVGDLNMAIEDCCIGRGLAALRHQSGSSSYSYYAMKDIQRQIEVYEDTGTVFGSINQKQLKSLEIIAPEKAIVKEFHRIVDGMDSKIMNQELLSRELTKLRDTLLPKLISGEVEV